MTLAEVLVSLLIVGVAMAAGVQALGSFAGGARSWQERSAAVQLASRLMAEIDVLPFQDPAGAVTIGVDAGETLGNRTQYDDIDDYHNWNESPPKDSSGNAMTGYAGYRQKVEVVFDTSLSTKTGLTFTSGAAKRVTVAILKDDRELARLVTVRTLNQAGD